MKQNDSHPAFSPRMTAAERRAATTLAGVFAMRMVGLSLVLPVLALYAHDLKGSTPMLIGLAIGAYGLTQALLQVPFGMASDHLGRKPVIVAGLLIFALGSVVAAGSESIVGVIVGRALQGAGAVAAAIMALAADLTREEHRTKAMAIIGMSIGGSFLLGLVLGPLFQRWIGVDGIFWLTAGLALVGIAVLLLWVPRPVHTRMHRDAELVPAQLFTVLKDAELLRLNFGILALHLVITATFVALPLALRDVAGLHADHHWWVYLPVLLLSAVAMVPFIFVVERRDRAKPVLVGAVIVLGVGQSGLALFHQSLTGIVVALFVFFTAFHLLEASLPSLISKVAPADKKGTAMGVYSSSQFFGAFLGGVAGGWLYGRFGITGVFLFCAALALAWGLVAATMRRPRNLSSYIVHVGEVEEREAPGLAARVSAVEGVAEAVVIVEEGLAYLKVDHHVLDTGALARVAGAPAGPTS